MYLYKSAETYAILIVEKIDVKFSTKFSIWPRSPSRLIDYKSIASAPSRALAAHATACLSIPAARILLRPKLAL